MKTKILLWIMSTKVYKFFLKYVIPNITFFTATGPTYFFKQRVRDNMKKGDVLLSKSAGHLTNVLIGGRYSHAAIVVGKNKIAEMTANGFDVVDVDKFCKQSTRICLLRLKNYDEEYGETMAQTAMSFSNTNYDLDFTLGVEALYCSELVYQSDIERRIAADLTDLARMGRPYISPMGLYDAQGLHIVYEWEDRL